MKQRFELSDGTHNKFWEVEVNATSLTTSWGRIGTSGQSKAKSFANAAMAEKERAVLIREKLAKGYLATQKIPNAPRRASPKGKRTSTKASRTAKESAEEFVFGKGKVLPKNFEQLLEKHKRGTNIEKLAGVFRKCHVDAYGGYDKHTAIMMTYCPLPLAKFLIDHGANVNFVDAYKNTPVSAACEFPRFGTEKLELLLAHGAKPHGTREYPALHSAAESGNTAAIKLLLKHGAKINATDNTYGMTALELSLCGVRDAVRRVGAVEALLAHGAKVSAKTKQHARNLSKEVAFRHGSSKRKFDLDETKAVARICELLDVEVAPYAPHDGKSRIATKGKSWQSQYRELTELLMPSSGSANTVQGEVISLSNRFSREIDGNGCINWRPLHRKFADAFLGYVQQGNALPGKELAMVKSIVVDLKKITPRSGDADHLQLAQLAVRWIRLNPTPIKLKNPGYFPPF